ncbi:hypothetical protein AALD74_14140 [Lachnospiraceae bacterium 48-21]|nr:hypothetical protein [Dorea sp.]
MITLGGQKEQIEAASGSLPAEGNFDFAEDGKMDVEDASVLSVLYLAELRRIFVHLQGGFSRA